MADGNPHQQILEQSLLTVAKAVEDKLDDEISALERLDLDDIEALRERRLQQMKRMAEKKKRWISLGHGEYTEITEKYFFATVKASDRVVCHFYRENWPCKVMDKHLDILAKQHMETRFLKIHAEKSPFLTDKLKIIVLPTLALIRNAKVDDYILGFDELGGKDDFSTEELEERLAKSQVLILDVTKSDRPGPVIIQLLTGCAEGVFLNLVGMNRVSMSFSIALLTTSIGLALASFHCAFLFLQICQVNIADVVQCNLPCHYGECFENF